MEGLLGGWRGGGCGVHVVFVGGGVGVGCEGVGRGREG